MRAGERRKRDSELDLGFSRNMSREFFFISSCNLNSTFFDIKRLNMKWGRGESVTVDAAKFFFLRLHFYSQIKSQWKVSEL